jgi:LPS-assembly protein
VNNIFLNFKTLSLYFFLITNFILFNQKIYCQSKNNLLLSSILFYDANDIEINKENNSIILKNSAEILIGDTYLSSNKIIIKKDIGLISAEGNINLINKNQKATASRITFDLIHNQIKMHNAEIYSDTSTIETDYLTEKTGITKAEIAFEQAKKLRAKEIENELKNLRNEYTRVKNLDLLEPEKYESKKIELTKKYSRLLARLTRTQFQPNAILAALPDKERDKILNRRTAVKKFSQENSNTVNELMNFSNLKGYIRLSASEIIQKNNNILILNNSIVTSCQCSQFKEPALYSFSSQNSVIEKDKYLTLHDVTLDILSIPVFYSPWLKFPIKTQRESGFLTPSSYISNNAGTEVSIPYFITLGPHADSTITYEYFSHRGSQINGEFRFLIKENSQLKMDTKFTQDRQYSKNWEINNSNIEQKLSTTSDQALISMLNSFKGTNLKNRWYLSNSINIPVLDRWSIKSNTQFVSDNTYISDYSSNNSNVTPKATVYGDTSTASKRFLNQEANMEFYGDNFIFSVRGQGALDLFATSNKNTPNRLPLIELNFLPYRYFNTPFVFSNNTSWENIFRFNQQNFIPSSQNIFSPQVPDTSQTGIFSPNGPKNPNDPYVQGYRISNTANILLPFPVNDYLNAYISSSAVTTQYFFPDAYPFGKTQPYLAYSQHKAHLDIPMYASLKNITPLGIITQHFVPFINLNYIPEVFQSSNLPNTYQLWYASDNAYSIATVEVGATTYWTIEKDIYEESDEPISRLTDSTEPEVANLNFFNDSLKEYHLDVEIDSKHIFEFSSENDAAKVFDLWAKKELENFFSVVNANEFKQNYSWPSGNYFKRKIAWNMTPLSISISTGYNILADKTAAEINKNAGPNIAATPSQKYTDILSSATFNLVPIFPFKANFKTSYNQYYNRLNSLEMTFNADLPYGLSLSYTQNNDYVANPLEQNSNSFIKKTQQVASAFYSPKNWIKLGYQWSKNTDPTVDPTTNLSNGRGYASSQNITFYNLQNCLDISFARNKAFGIPENFATYVVSLNFKFFGYSYDTPPLKMNR